MGFSRTILKQKQSFLDGRYIVIINVLEVEKSLKFPCGIKAKYILLNSEKNCSVLLVDNHEPFGFHMHTDLPNNKDVRKILEVDQYIEALELFEKEVMEILNNEK